VAGRGLTAKANVVHARIDAEAEVAGQRPGGGRPGEEADIGLVDEREADDDGGVLDVLIVLAGLEVGQGRARGRAEGHHLWIQTAHLHERTHANKHTGVGKETEEGKRDRA